ncbi:hypothetical protein MKEN_00918900 [Mycena kentingensis (nom. inval.)]|nr:hypothetical protein MKEN_00918900 [Mycena kentingensis (nom. inval.)]
MPAPSSPTSPTSPATTATSDTNAVVFPAISFPPTPPSTTHRVEKENRVPRRSTVNWSPTIHQTRTFAADDPPTTSASKSRPSKSILKKHQQQFAAFPVVVSREEREATPEPTRPDHDPSYLASSVAALTEPNPALDGLIRAYSVLAARIRAHITLASDSKAPLLFPLRKHRSALVEAIVRDIKRCTTDPNTLDTADEDREEEADIHQQRHPALSLLPSPKTSPKKKKGTTARKAKYGRDLCTTCHSVLKFLAVVFTLPAVYSVFNVPELRSILTEVLGIPLENELPTPNARKTYALSIWLLQSQRLPASVLDGASDRIAFAIGRGIDGELGKEGKKGSTSDGLKAIHDLCVYQAAIFVPKFEPLLPSVLGNLLAPSLAIRTQACHALGGFARGLTSLPLSPLQTRVSATVVEYLTKQGTPSPKSPTKSTESALVRTLRTTMKATEVQNVAQGPVWSLTTLAALLVLANSAVYASEPARRVFGALLSCATNHKKSSVRTLGAAVWRCVVWAWSQPLLPSDGEDEYEVDEDVSAVNTSTIEASRKTFWTQVVSSVYDMGVGVSTVAALLEENDHDLEENVGFATAVLKSMSTRTATLTTAIDVLARMVSCEEPEPDTPWSWAKLLPRGLLSASPGLLTADYNALEAPVRAVLGQCLEVKDVRSLYRDEVVQDGVFEKLVAAWRDTVGSLAMRDDEPVSPNLISTWRNLLQAQVVTAKENEYTDTDWAVFSVNNLLEILSDSNIDITLKHGQVPCTDGPEPKNALSNAALKIRLMRPLWMVTREVCSGDLSAGGDLAEAAEKLVFHLMKWEDDFTESDSNDYAARREWALLCAEVLVVCEAEDVQEFWKYDGSPKSKWNWTPEIRAVVWRSFAEVWTVERQTVWPAIAVLLAIPLNMRQHWDLVSTDLDLWEALLEYGIAKANDDGMEDVTVLEDAAKIIADDRSPTATAAARIADVLLCRLFGITEDNTTPQMLPVEELPEALLELVNDILMSSYPPEKRIRQQSLWTLRTVSRAIEHCPIEYVLDLLKLLEGGLCVWLADEHQALTEAEYVYDAVNLYEVVLMKLTTLPMELEVLAAAAPILASALTSRKDKVTVAFSDFWQATYASMDVPEKGWPKEVQECLAVAFGPPPSALSPAFEDMPIRFGAPSPEANCATTVPRPTTPTPCTTPHAAPLLLLSSPTRQLTSDSSPLRYLHASPSTPKRTPRGSPSKRRRLEEGDKENESPRVALFAAPSSVMDRIGLVSPGAASKKLADGERSKKRRRLSDGQVDASEDEEEEREERLVEADLLPFANASSSSPKKRKRMFMEAVEVPRRSTVISRMTGKAAPRKVTPHSKKRSRDDLDSDDPFSNDTKAGMSSSDDDSYIGQVTPFHVVSPALRVVSSARDDDPPSSDDSSAGGSPTKSFIARRLQRMGSHGRVVSL